MAKRILAGAFAAACLLAGVPAFADGSEVLSPCHVPNYPRSVGQVVAPSVDTNQAVCLHDGAPVTGATLPSGGEGLIGWLSAIWEELEGGGGNASVGTNGAASPGSSTQIGTGSTLQPVSPSNPLYVAPELTDTTGSGSITAADTASTTTTGQGVATIVTGTPTTGSYVQISIAARAAIRTTITGTWTGTGSLEGSYDGANWYPYGAHYTGATGPIQGSTFTANGSFLSNSSGFKYFRVRATATVTGTMNVAFDATNADGSLYITNPLKIVDVNGTNVATVKAASTAPASTDTAFEATLRPDCATVATCTSLPAGSNAIGNVGGFEFNASVIPTVQNASYAAGQCMGGLQTISIGSTSGLSGILTQVQLASKGGATSNDIVYIWSKNPTNTTCTDKSNFVSSQTDNQYLVGSPISLTPSLAVSAQDTATYSAAGNLTDNFVNGSSNTDLYVAIVSNATQTPASTTDLRLNIQGVKDQP